MMVPDDHDLKGNPSLIGIEMEKYDIKWHVEGVIDLKSSAPKNVLIEFCFKMKMFEHKDDLVYIL